MIKRKIFNKEQWSWIMYDWANSAYSIVITTAILPIYYKSMTSGVLSDSNSTLYWTLVNTFSALCVALFGPLFGSISDINGYKKKFFTIMLLVGVLSTVALAFVPYGSWPIIIIVYLITIVGFSGANIFYDSFITDICDKDEMDKVSANGFAYGYIGSVFPFILSLVLIAIAPKIGLSTVLATKMTFVLTSLWWGLFTIPLLKDVRQKYGVEKRPKIIRSSFKEITNTLKSITEHKALLMFLIAYFFYIDGVGTIIKLATIIGSDLGIDANTMLIVLLLTQLVAFPFTILFGYLSNKYKNSNLIIVTIIVYIFVCIFAMFILRDNIHFYILGFVIGTVQGAVQSLSRSYFAQMIPKEKSNEFFGFYNIVGKFSAVLGPLIYGGLFYLTSSIPIAVFGIMMLFIIGLILFIKANNLRVSQNL